MSFPLDPANLGYTKVNDLAYDSKLAAGLQQLGKFTPDFAAIKGHIAFNSSVTTGLKYLPVEDKNTGEPVSFRNAEQILALRASQAVPFLTPVSITGVQFGLATDVNVAPYRMLTENFSGAALANADLISMTGVGFVPATGVDNTSYLVARVDVAAAQTQGQIDVSVLKL